MDLLSVLPVVQEQVLGRGIPVPGWRDTEAEHQRFASAVAQVLTELRLATGMPPGEAAKVLARAMTGIGVLQPLLEQDGVEEIIVRGGFVQIERRGVIEDVGNLAPDSHFEQVARRAADLGQRMLKGDRPYVLVDLPDGSRFTAIIPPLSRRGTAINIRVFAHTALSLDDLARFRTFEVPEEDNPAATGSEPDMLPPVARFLRAIAERNVATVLVSGEFGAGKTTLLNAMSRYVPDDVQLAVVETFEELKIAHPHPLRVVVPEGREGNFPTMDEVLNIVITRMRPDLLIVGEIVRDEAPRFLDAINLGKKSWSTIHGNDAMGALYRLETKALVSGLPHTAIREQIAAGVDLIVHMRKYRGRRYVAEVARVEGLDADGHYRLRYLYRTGWGGDDLQFLTKELEELGCV
ncbi:MAG: CpaF family protein [Chloroflexi bacterium]|nr:CpaF family protein [Chloroflexota bacterium]